MILIGPFASALLNVEADHPGPATTTNVYMTKTFAENATKHNMLGTTTPTSTRLMITGVNLHKLNSFPDSAYVTFKDLAFGYTAGRLLWSYGKTLDVYNPRIRQYPPSTQDAVPQYTQLDNNNDHDEWGECVSAVTALARTNTGTSYWMRGAHVVDGGVAIGTVIATFSGNGGTTYSGSKAPYDHVAVLKGYDHDPTTGKINGIYVWDQNWASPTGAGEATKEIGIVAWHKYPRGGSLGGSFDANNYYVVNIPSATVFVTVEDKESGALIPNAIFTKVVDCGGNTLPTSPPITTGGWGQATIQGVGPHSSSYAPYAAVLALSPKEYWDYTVIATGYSQDKGEWQIFAGDNSETVPLDPIHTQTSVTVTVEDVFGTKIHNAQITVSKDGQGHALAAATTDSNGQATLNGISGTWTYTVSAPGYVTNTGTWQILANQYNGEVVYLATTPQATITFTVKKGGVAGTIYIYNALISIIDGGGNSRSKYTGSESPCNCISDGQATITGVSGTWQYTVSAAGYYTNTGTLPASGTSTGSAFIYLYSTSQEPVHPG